MTTKTDTRIPAFDAYIDGWMAVHGQIIDIKMLLKNHAKATQAQPTDWSYAGDMEHVSALLGQVIDFLNGDDNE